MEWATSSPPPAFNFAVLPQVQGEEAYWAIKHRAREQASLRDLPDYEFIKMPRNSPTGFVCAFFATLMGFALIWHIWWMVALGIVGAWVTFVVFAWRDIPITSFQPQRSPALIGQIMKCALKPWRPMRGRGRDHCGRFLRPA